MCDWRKAERIRSQYLLVPFAEPPKTANLKVAEIYHELKATRSATVDQN
jgi:hypothetical protein